MAALGAEGDIPFALLDLRYRAEIKPIDNLTLQFSVLQHSIEFPSLSKLLLDPSETISADMRGSDNLLGKPFCWTKRRCVESRRLESTGTLIPDRPG